MEIIINIIPLSSVISKPLLIARFIVSLSAISKEGSNVGNFPVGCSTETVDSKICDSSHSGYFSTENRTVLENQNPQKEKP